MSAPVNVLAVMDDLLSTPTGMLADEFEAMHEARAAVAELIEADKEYDEALRLANIGYGSTDEDRAAQQRLREAIAMRRAALALVTGGAE